MNKTYHRNFFLYFLIIDLSHRISVHHVFFVCVTFIFNFPLDSTDLLICDVECLMPVSQVEGTKTFSLRCQ